MQHFYKYFPYLLKQFPLSTDIFNFIINMAVKLIFVTLFKVCYEM